MKRSQITKLMLSRDRDLIHKTVVGTIVLLAALFLMTACSNSIAENDDTVTYEEDYIQELITAEPYIETEYSAFKKDNFVIIEWGEALELKNEDGEDIIIREERLQNTYVCYPVKYIHMFKGTLQSEYDLIFSGEYKNSLYYILKPSFEILKDYDDVVVVCSEYAHLIEKGRTDLVQIRGSICFDFPYYGNDGSLDFSDRYYYGGSPYPEDEPSLVTALDVSDCRHTHDVHIINLINVKDGRIDLGDASYQTDDSGNHFYGVASTYEYVNNRLISLGYGDKIFRDGMTVEELDEYFELVTDSDTFAPLFED